MKELILQNSKGNDITTSLIVAEVFGKEHKHVLRDIDDLSCSEQFRLSNFGLSFNIRELPNGGHKEERYYEITKDGFSFLVMGYTGETAGQFKEKFINEFNKRESLLKSDDYILFRSQEILSSRVKCVETKLANANRLLEVQQAKVCFANAVEASGKSCLIGELAKIIRQNGVDIGGNRLFEWLRLYGYLCVRGESKNRPTQKAMDLGLFEIKETIITMPSGKARVSITTKVTGKGQIFFVNKFLRNETLNLQLVV